MGNCGSSAQDISENDPKPAQTQKTDEARQQAAQGDGSEILIKPATFDQYDVKILTLGAGECGKSTIWRQLKMIYCGGFNQEERESMKLVIKINLISDIKSLIDAMSRNGHSVGADLQNQVDLVMSLQLSEEELLPEVGDAILELWRDPMIQRTYQQANSIGLGDHAAFFLDSVQRIAAKNYVPTDEDILKSRIRTVGITQLDFQINDKKTELIDVGGQKSERARWQKCFTGVHYLLFVVSLSDFDQCMFEDENVSRTKDSIDLFGSIANSEIFKNKPIFLVLNKLDLFEKKLQESPDKFRHAYEGFEGDVTNVHECIEHVKRSFMAKLDPNRAPEGWVEALSACAMEEKSIRELFQKVGKKVLETAN